MKTVLKTPKYKREVAKLLKNRKLSIQDVEKMEELFSQDWGHASLRYHNITCRRDKNMWSVSIFNTGYRVLVSDFGEEVIFNTLLNHDKYNRATKDC